MSFQSYLDFVYEYYLIHSSSLKCLIDLINSINWALIPERVHPLGSKGYSLRILYKIFFIATFKKLKTYHDCFPSEPTLSRFGYHYFDEKLFSNLYKNTLTTVDIDTSNLFVDSHLTLANSSMNNPEQSKEFLCPKAFS